mmetsp:Transcript_17992/g.22152  ORF Transcript_17992/g.22152 Transcript_17992/m.22152 type:complete len:340 (-) Transcript_17992:1939-2958(-)
MVCLPIRQSRWLKASVPLLRRLGCRSQMLLRDGRTTSLTKGDTLKRILPRRKPTAFKLKVGGVCILGCAVMQYLYGSTENFYKYSFITNKNPDDLADFYGTEDFMELFCVFPFVVKLLMRGASFDNEGVVHTMGFPGEMEVNMLFTDREEDVKGDGNLKTVFFNKREEFRDKIGPYELWSTVQNFGFNVHPDGACEVYHHGESFRGPFFLRLILHMHAKYVIWATEHHINHHAFAESEDEEEVEERSRQEMPIHIVHDHLFKDFVSSLIGDIESQRDKLNLEKDKEAELDGHHRATIRRLKTISKVPVKDIQLSKRMTLTEQKTARGSVTKIQIDTNES